MTTHEIKIRELSAVSQQKAHIEAIRRLQLALMQELRSAGVQGIDRALSEVNAAIKAREDEVGTQFDNALFELTTGAELAA